jgi:hypothetical protein
LKSAVYKKLEHRATAKYFIFFNAEYSLLTSKGGLYLFNPKPEVKELLKKG